MPLPEPFHAEPAVREQTALLVGISAPSGGGKTFSALRLARGIVSVTGGEIYFVDTDNRRSLQYADEFKKADGSPGFRFVNFDPPHSSERYAEAIAFCVGQADCGVVVVDSMSHEHEGSGGMIEFHEAEWKRLGGSEGVKALAWSKPKAARRRLLHKIQRLGKPAIFCFRAKEGIKPVKDDKGKVQFVQQGFTPIAGDEFVFEMTLNALLMPAAKGVPTWLGLEPGERKMTKLPLQFEFLESRTKPLDEELGSAFARWSVGGVAAPKRQAIADAREESPPDAEDGGGSHTADDPAAPAGGQEKPQGGDDKPARTETRAERDERENAERAERLRAQGFNVEPTQGEPAVDQGTDAGDGDPWSTFAEVLVEAEDWPAIEAGFKALAASESFKASDYARQMLGRRAAYNRLRELVAGGLRFDFLNSAQAFRCYVEAEDEPAALTGNWRAFSHPDAGPWKGLPAPAREVFAKAVQARLDTLEAASNAGEYQ